MAVHGLTLPVSRLFLTLSLSLSAMVGNLAAQSNWTPTTAGPHSWQTATLWSTNPTIPNSAGSVANVSTNITAAQTINLDGAVTLGTLNLGDTGSTYFAYTIAAGTGGSLIFDNGSNNAVLARTTASTATDIISANITLNSALDINAGTAGGLSLTGIISGNKGLTKSGAGTLDLSNVGNNFVGAVRVTAGILRATNDNIFGLLNPLEMTGGTLNLNNTSQTFASLNGTGIITFSISGTATRNLTIGGDNQDASYAGTITGTGSGAVSTIVKVGTGTQSIGGTGDNSSARLQVDAGKVILNKVSSITASAVASVVTVNAGTLQLDGPAFEMLYRPENYVDQIHSNSQIILNGTSIFDLNGRSENIDQITGDGGLVTNTAAGTESVLYIGVDTSGSGAAQINDGAGIIHLVKTSIGFSGAHQSVGTTTTQTLTAASNFSGSVFANRGTLTLSGANGALTGVGAADKTIDGLMASAQNVGITLEREAAIELNNATDANTNRLRDGVDVFMGAGASTLRINGHTTTPINEIIGEVTVLAGNRGNILIDHNGDNPNTGWTFGSLTRQAGSTLQIRTVDNLANAWSTGSAAGQASITLLDGGASLQKVGGGGAAGTVNRSIALGVTIGVNNLSDHFATVDGNNLRPLTSAEYQNSRASAPIAFDSTYMAANPLGDRNANIIFDTVLSNSTNVSSLSRITSSVAFNSLRLESNSSLPSTNDFSRILFLTPNSTVYLGGVTAGTDDDVPGTIAPGSGMLLFGRTTAGTTSGNQFITGGRLDFGSREALLINFSGSNAYIRSVISGTGGLTKGGANNIILDAANTYSGLTRMNEGIVYAFNSKSFGNSTQVQVEGSSAFYMGNGIEINGVDAIFTNRSSSSHLIRSDSGYSYWGGNLIIDNIDSLGYRTYDAQVTVGTDRALSITGNIYGSSTVASNDTEMSSPRLVTTSGTANGVLNLRGVFSDKAGGATATGNEVLHFQVTGANELNVNIAQAWKSNGRFMLRQGIVRYEGEGNFFAEGVTPNLHIKPNNTGANRIASFLLGKDGQVLNTGGTLVQIGDSGERQNTSDTTVMLGSDLMTGGTVTFGALNTTWDANPQNATGLAAGNNRDIRFLAASGFDSSTGQETPSTVIFNGRIIDDTAGLDTSEFASLTKVGRGTLVFNGSNAADSDIDGGLNALAGSFVINYSEAGTNRRHFSNGTTAPQMTLAGGRVVMQGATTGGVVESFGVFNVARGGSEVVSLSGTNVLSISANTLNRASGGTVNFVDTNAATGGEIRVGGVDNTLIGYWATFNSEDFAYRLGTTDTVGAPTTGFYTSDVFGTGINSVVTTSASATLARSLKITAGVTLTGSLTLEQGALLIPASNTAAVTLGASGDTLTTSAGADLIVHNYGSGGLTINNAITGSQALVISGTGVTTLTAASTGFTGKTSINGGTLVISADNQLGTVAAATPDQLYLNGGTLRTTANMTLDANRGITLGGEGGTFDVAASTKLTYGGIMATEAFLPSVVTGAPPNLASGDLIKTGAGVLELTNSLNTYEGMTDVRAGTLRVAFAAAAVTPFGTNRSWHDATYVRNGAVLEFATTAGSGTNDTTTAEWFSFEGGSTLRNAGTLPLYLNGVIEFKPGRIHISSPNNSGAQIYLNTSGGYITGSGDIYKTGDAYLLFMENNRDWTGNLYALDGITESRSAVNPFGTGAGVIELGHNGAAHNALGYTSNGGNVQLQMYSDDSAATVSTVNRSILVNEEGGGSAQTKRIGARNGDTGDVFQYGATGNPDGHKITLNDDVQLYYVSGRGSAVNSDPDFLTRIYIEYNADIVNGTTGNKNIATVMDQDGTGNATNAVDDIDNYAYFILNGNNTGWIGNLTTGNGTTNDADRNHIVRFGTSQAISASNNVAMGNQATLQMYGNDITIGNLSTTGAAGLMFIENNSSVADATLTVRQTSTQTVNVLFRDGTVLFKDANDQDRRLGLTLDATADATKLVTTQNNTYTGKTTVNRGVLELSTVNGAINDSAWLQVNAQGTFANATSAAYRYDGVVSGTGRVTGNFIAGDNVGSVLSQGVIKPGNSSVSNSIATAGDARGTLTFTGNLELAAPTSPAISVVRAQLQIAGATGNVASTVTGDSSVWVAALPTTHASLVTGLAGDHDHLEITGSLTVNDGSVIDVITFGSTYAPAYGDVFNLMDWAGALNVGTGFSAGTNLRSGGLGGGELNLPDISAGGFFWDVSLFTSHGVIVVVPEPSRILLLAFALVAIFGRRRR